MGDDFGSPNKKTGDKKTGEKSGSPKKKNARKPSPRRKKASNAGHGGGRKQGGGKDKAGGGKGGGSGGGKGGGSGGGSGGGFNILANPAFAAFIKGASSSVAAKATSALGRSGKNDDKTPSGKCGDFDLYLFAMSWAPRFCCTNEGQCKKEKMDGVEDLAVHGLWPAYFKSRQNTTYPSNCEYTGKASAPKGRMRHEWEKHGTCTGLNSDGYFAEEDRIFNEDVILDVREQFDEVNGGTLPLGSILSTLGGERRVAIMTDKFCRLTEITTCWAKNADGTVGAQVDCPDHVLGSSRNSAATKGHCGKVYLDEANTCSNITKVRSNRVFK